VTITPNSEEKGGKKGRPNGKGMSQKKKKMVLPLREKHDQFNYRRGAKTRLPSDTSTPKETEKKLSTAAD